MTVIVPEKVKKILRKMDKSVSSKIISYLDEVSKLENPRSRGKGLTSDKAGIWRYRVGDYRILCNIVDEKLIITVIKIDHRSEVYK